MNEILNIIFNNVLDIAIAVITLLVSRYAIPFIQTDLKPWLEEKRIYSLVQKFVAATEKLAETGIIEQVNKKDYVIHLLKENNIEITPTIQAFIESAVKNLDLVVDTAKNEILKERR